MKKNLIAAVLAVYCLSACVPSPQNILSAHSWQCGGEVVKFRDDGIVTTMSNGTKGPVEYRSSYKLVESQPGMFARVQLDDDKPMRVMFGGSAPLTTIDVGYADLQIVLMYPGNQLVCTPIRNPQ
jgi:hypothetical protein